MTTRFVLIVMLLAGLTSLSAVADDDNWKSKRWQDKPAALDQDQAIEDDDDFEDDDEDEGEGDFQEEEISPKSLPSAVKKQVSKQFSKFRVLEAMKITEDQEIYYMIVVRTSKGEAELGVAPDGSALFIERAISPKDLPAAVKKAVQDAYGRVRVNETRIMRDFEEEEDPERVYGLELVKDGRELYVSFSGDGERLEEEFDEDGDDEFEDEDEFDEEDE